MKNLMTALLKSKAAMPSLTKDSDNPHFKSKFASLAAVVGLLREPLADNGIVYIESPVPELPVGQVAIDLTLYHVESGEMVTYRSATMQAQQLTPQGIGSALTYCRRYHLMTVFGLAPEDDDGNAAERQPERRKPRRQAEPEPDAAPKLDTAILRTLHGVGSDYYGKGWDAKRPELVAKVTQGRATSASDLTPDEADKLINGIRDRLAKRNFDAEHSDKQTDAELWRNGASTPAH